MQKRTKTSLIWIRAGAHARALATYVYVFVPRGTLVFFPAYAL